MRHRNHGGHSLASLAFSEDRIRAMREEGEDVATIAQRLGCYPELLRRFMKSKGIDTKRLRGIEDLVRNVNLALPHVGIVTKSGKAIILPSGYRGRGKRPVKL